MKKIWDAYYQNRKNKGKVKSYYNKIENDKNKKKNQKRVLIVSNTELIDNYKFYNSSLWLKHRYFAFVQQGTQCKLCDIYDVPVDVYSCTPEIRLNDYPKFLSSLSILCKGCSNEKKLKAYHLQKSMSPSVRIKNKEKDDFFNSQEWIDLRNLAFSTHGRKCSCCKEIEGQFHADHIKPRSKYPSLELLLNNIQILCWRCNLGKSNFDETNWQQIL